eukprot:m.205213 g.205213  ORF g.205213 m.205213 type:complete len:112 (+) comp39657_c2_seq1:288-623(+)
MEGLLVVVGVMADVECNVVPAVLPRVSVLLTVDAKVEVEAVDAREVAAVVTVCVEGVAILSEVGELVAVVSVVVFVEVGFIVHGLVLCLGAEGETLVPFEAVDELTGVKIG